MFSIARIIFHVKFDGFQNRQRGHFYPVPHPQRGHLRRVHQVESKRERVVFPVVNVLKHFLSEFLTFGNSNKKLEGFSEPLSRN